MNIVNRVTFQHMKQNKRKTLVTLTGIVLSVALITAISSFAASFLETMREFYIKSGGDWHVLFSNVPVEQIEAVKEDSEVKTVIISKTLGNVELANSQREDKPYLMIRAYDQEAQKAYPTVLLEGRYPENSQEIVLSEQLKKDGVTDIQIGDTITFSVGNRVGVFSDGTEMSILPEREYFPSYSEGVKEYLTDLVSRTYTVTGIIENPSFESRWQAGYTAITCLDDALLNEVERVNVAIRAKSINSNIYTWPEKIAEKIGLSLMDENDYENIRYNSSLLSTYLLSANTGIYQMLTVLQWIMALIVVVGSVSVIYSAFSISVSERSRYLGMLSSVGATKRQKMQSVYFEGVCLGAAGIPLGILVGLLGTYITLLFVNPLMQSAFELDGKYNIRLVISPEAIGSAVLLAIVTIGVSAWIPARRASKITPIDAIRHTKDIKLTSKQIRTSWLTRKLFGFEGGIALKNLKRNRRRYRATIISLVLSIILFLSVSSFAVYLGDAYLFEANAISSYDFEVGLNRIDEEELVSEIKKLDNIMDVVIVSTVYQTVEIDSELFSKKIQDDLSGGATEQVLLKIIAADDDEVKRWEKEYGADLKKREDSEEIPVILDNRWMHIENGKRIYESFFDIHRGEKLQVTSLNYDEVGNISYLPVTLIAEGLTEVPLAGQGMGANWNTITVYTSNEGLAALMKNIEGDENTQNRYCFINSDDPENLDSQLEELKEEKSNFYFNNTAETKNQINQMLTIVNIFVYGFITLISLICITSVFNTISTSMALRRREYAMLNSVGMEKRQFHRMIGYESIFYGLKALIYGLPLGTLAGFGIYMVIDTAFSTGYYLLWGHLLAVSAGVMGIIGLTMFSSMRKIEKENIVDVLKSDSI